MSLKPCLDCGTPTNGPRCTEHATAGPRDHIASFNNGRWKTLSKRLRRLAPFCEECATTVNLTVDHVLPVSKFPELTYAVENCRVLCNVCNGKRGNRFTATEAQAVLDRLQTAYRRRPTESGRHRVNVALRARGDTPNGQPDRPRGRRGGQ